MSPKSMVWVSVLTLLISIATLAMVWQMQQNLAHTDADAALGTPEAGCKNKGGTWTEQINADGETIGGECAIKDPVSGDDQIRTYDENGTRTGTR